MDKIANEFLGRIAATTALFSSPIHDVSHQLADAAAAADNGDPGASVVPLIAGRIAFIRSARLMRELASNPLLERGSSVHLLREVFGDALFLLPRGPEHSARKQMFKDHAGRSRIDALMPVIASNAAEAAERLAELAARAPAPTVDMAEAVMRYLFRVASQVIAGDDAGLESEAQPYRQHSDIVLDGCSSPLRAALATVDRRLAAWLAGSSRAAARAMHHVGRALLVTAAAHPDSPTLALQMMRRHGIDPGRVTPDFAFPEPLLDEITMIFAASTFTSSQLMLKTLDHFMRHPEALEALRRQARIDFPRGVGELHILPLCDTVRQLMPALLGNSPVGSTARDVVGPLRFQDDRGETHQLDVGDRVIFDLDALQAAHLAPLRERLAGAGGSALDQLDARNNDVVKAFFEGPFQCPGRFLAMADSLLFVLAVLTRLDLEWAGARPPLRRGLVDHFPGAALMQPRPAP